MTENVNLTRNFEVAANLYCEGDKMVPITKLTALPSDVPNKTL
jgi:hypothetical protein